MIQGKKILITGGAGFIGSHMAERLAPTNDVTLLDVEFDGPIKYTALASDDKVRKINGDVCNADQIEDEVANCQVLLHFASILGVQKVIDHARPTMDTILQGTRNVMEAASRNKNIERIINISTSEVYGNIMSAEEGTAPASVGTNNDARLCYAAAKLMGEHIVWAYHRDFKLPTVIIRPFNIYGPRRKASNAIGHFVVKALSNQDVQILLQPPNHTQIFFLYGHHSLQPE